MGYSFDKANHIHSLDGVPLTGTTTALEVISKPLTWWASGQACEKFGWVNPKKNPKEVVLQKAIEGYGSIKGMDIDAYITHLNEAYRAHNTFKEKAADSGIDLHALIEEYIKTRMDSAPDDSYLVDDRVAPFHAWAKKDVKRFLWSEMNHYSRPHWVGGQSDFGYEDMNGKIVLGDIKSAKEAYFSHFVQAGGYDIQITENGGFTAKGVKMFELPRPIDYYAIFPMGGKFERPTTVTNTKLFRDAFIAALQLYRAKKVFEEVV